MVFHSDRGASRFQTQVYRLDLESGRITRLTDGPAVNAYPSWSPDGRRIAYTSEQDGNRDVWVMDADGTNRRPLTRHPGFDGDPGWTPDGTAVLFSTGRFGGQELAIIPAPR